MGVMEIILIVLGLIVFIVSFLLPAGKRPDVQDSERISEDTIREMVGKEVEDAKSQIGDIVDETITYAMEKTERSMDRLTNEKMMAVNEYSDTVLEQINKNHKEAVFLYDMLNDKHENLKSTVSQAAKTVSEVKQTVKDAEVLAKEVESISKEPELLLKEAAGVPNKPESIKEKPETAHSGGTDHADITDGANTGFAPIEPVRIIPDAQHSKAGASQKEKEPDRNGRTDEVLTAPMNKPEPRGKNASEVPEVEITLNPGGRAGGRNSNERILELHKAGKSNMAIARELGLGIGEVKLVIDLFEGL